MIFSNLSDNEVFFNLHTHHNIPNQLGIVQNDTYEEFNPSTKYSVGIHPMNISNNQKNDLTKIEQTLKNQNCLAIGEIGLDNRYENMNKQEELFIDQLKIASKLNKPIILHCVNTWSKSAFLHLKYASQIPLIFHGFNKATITDQVINHPNSYISIGNSIQTNISLQKVCAKLPIEQLFIETDIEIEGLEKNYELIASIKKLSLGTLKKEIFKNAKRVFNL